MKILPKTISNWYNDYTITPHNDGYISQVMNKSTGALMEFRGIEQDMDVVGTIKVFTQLLTRMHGTQEVQILNIFCIHFSSFKDEITFDTVYLEAGETEDDHMEFKQDTTGRQLDYKILIKDLSVYMVLYNSGEHVTEVQSVEARYLVGQ